jgi:predicted MFS family arabinose efflux permease
MFGPLPCMTILANWFIVRRGTAIGIAATGTTTAGFLVPPITSFLMEHYTWRGALLAYALGCAALAFPAIWLWVVKRPEEVGQSPDGQPPTQAAAPETSELRESSPPLVRQPAFWLIASIFGIIASASVVLVTSLVPYASDLGIPRERAAYILSCFALFTSLGKVSFGLLVDRIDKRVALWLALGLQAAGWLLLLSQPGFELLLVAAALFGLGTGSSMPIQGAMLGAVFGRAVFGRVMGLMGPVMLVPLVVAPPFVGYLYDTTGSYTLPLTLFLASFAISATLLLFLRIPREA